MTAGSGATRFASLSRPQAAGVLALWVPVTAGEKAKGAEDDEG